MPLFTYVRIKILAGNKTQMKITHKSFQETITENIKFKTIVAATTTMATEAFVCEITTF